MDPETVKFVEEAIKVFNKLKEAENLLKNIDMEDDITYSLPDYIKKDLEKFFNKV